MSIELVVDRTRPLEFTYNGRALKARPMPLRMALSLNEPAADGELSVSVELMAKVVSECVLFSDTGERVYSVDEILDGDTTAMLPLFKAVTDLFSPEDARKN